MPFYKRSMIFSCAAGLSSRIAPFLEEGRPRETPAPCNFFAGRIRSCLLYLTIGGFPLWFCLSHPTLVMGFFCLLLSASTLPFFLSQLKDSLGRGVFLFCLLLLLGGVFGFGNITDGVAMALFASTFFSVRALCRDSALRFRLRMLILAVASVTAIFGILQYFFLHSAPQWVDMSRFSEIGMRVTSFFDNPNILAIYLLSVLPVSLVSSLKKGEGNLFRMLGGVSFGAVFLCLILTWTRGAWLGAILEIVLVLFLCGIKSRACLFCAPLALIGVLPLLPQSIIKRFMSISLTGDSSIRYRLYTWQGVKQLLLSYPEGIGVGESAFSAVYPRYALSGIERVGHAHNVFLQILCELGIGGFLIFCTLLLLLLVRGIRAPVGDGFGIALCGLSVMGLFDHLWYAPAFLSLFFALCGMSDSMKGGRKQI